MALDITKPYLTRKECEMLLRTVELSRSDSVSIPRHLATIFEQAEYAAGAKGSFSYAAYGRNIHVDYECQSGGARQTLLKRESLNALVPALANEQLPQSSTTAKPTARKQTPRSSLALKDKTELAPEWKTYYDLPALVKKEAENAGTRLVLKGPINKSMQYLAEAFQGETGIVDGIRCHKYAGSHGASLAIHEDDMPQYFALLKKLSLSVYKTNNPEKREASMAR